MQLVARINYTTGKKSKTRTLMAGIDRKYSIQLALIMVTKRQTIHLKNY